MDDRVVMESTGAYWLDLYDHSDDISKIIKGSSSLEAAITPFIVAANMVRRLKKNSR